MIKRKYLQFNLADKSVQIDEWEGDSLAKAGRYLIAKTLVGMNVATVDPLGPKNPLIFSAGPFAGTSMSNANRISVGCKSPLTGGIKEANGGGTFAYAMGRLEICGFTLHGKSDDWTIIHINKAGEISYFDADPYLGKKNYEVASQLHERFGRKISLALCGPVGEYEGLLAGISFRDNDNRPSRLAARGGVGAVMGSKRVKAIVLEMTGMPPLHERKKTLQAIKQYASWVKEDTSIQTVYNPVGTMAMGDYTNEVGGIPTNNFTKGSQPVDKDGNFMMGGSYIRDLNLSRGGQHTHACMPGCTIRCSNVYHDENGEELTSPVEYETLALLGTNCGLTHPDNLAVMNQNCNELGVDTIETGAMIAVLMDAGLAKFGDVAFMQSVFDEMLVGTEKGKLWASGTYRVGKHYGLHRIPTVKKQAISAYDPRVIEITGITMMVTAQGADHTAGNVPKYASRDKDLSELIERSLEAQISSAAADSIGICIFGRGVTNPNVAYMADAINSAIGSDLTPDFFHKMGRETLMLERQFNLDAGFTVEDDDLAAFFYNEPLEPTGQTARFFGKDVHDMYEDFSQVYAQGIPKDYAR
ncbi:MAG: aldehyde ferredoxin oxidoreductase C-terminal domain-containing protein [Chloroflexota bacterium]